MQSTKGASQKTHTNRGSRDIKGKQIKNGGFTEPCKITRARNFCLHHKNNRGKPKQKQLGISNKKSNDGKKKKKSVSESPVDWERGLLLIGEDLLTTLPASHTLLLLLPCLGAGQLSLLLGSDDLVAHGVEGLLIIIAVLL